MTPRFFFDEEVDLPHARLQIVLGFDLDIGEAL